MHLSLALFNRANLCKFKLELDKMELEKIRRILDESIHELLSPQKKPFFSPISPTEQDRSACAGYASPPQRFSSVLAQPDSSVSAQVPQSRQDVPAQKQISSPGLADATNSPAQRHAAVQSSVHKSGHRAPPCSNSFIKSPKEWRQAGDLRDNYNKLQDEIVTSRRRAAELERRLGKYERQYAARRQAYEQLRRVRAQYRDLRKEFERSEDLRMRQKRVIEELRGKLGAESI